ILNPLQPGCEFPFKHLAGVGVAFYLAMGVRSALLRQGYWPAGEAAPNLKRLLDLVAIGTIGDMVPLVGVNRILSIAGLEELNDHPRPGLRQLLRMADALERRVTAEDIGYRIGPRLNAPGRLGEADLALELLVTDDGERAAALAGEVDAINRRRQELVEEVHRQATAAANDATAGGRRTLVLHGEHWHGGVLGIVASKMVDVFARPVIMLRSEGAGLVKGSGRSVEGLDLHQALTRCSDLLEQYGGHPSAAGLTLRAENLDAFRERLEAIVAEQLDEEAMRPVLWIDGELGSPDLGDHAFFDGFQRLAPFGVGNPEPVFVSAAAVRLEQPRVVGNNHLQFSWRVNGTSWHGIAFGCGHHLHAVQEQPTRLVFMVRRNSFRGREQWQLQAVDFDQSPTS
ncbi:MAG: DHHA1 domain-containing protein, partial [Desulfobulbaceae bacterium]|nr:DHHA1 domain-containing protein [Desulfobulbaceae bacterium]